MFQMGNTQGRKLTMVPFKCLMIFIAIYFFSFIIEAKEQENIRISEDFRKVLMAAKKQMKYEKINKFNIKEISGIKILYKNDTPITYLILQEGWNIAIPVGGIFEIILRYNDLKLENIEIGR